MSEPKVLVHTSSDCQLKTASTLSTGNYQVLVVDTEPEKAVALLRWVGKYMAPHRLPVAVRVRASWTENQHYNDAINALENAGVVIQQIR